ncbi:uncharacterized protein LOC129292699 isoform X1 [Prosopis cineraria]|uniref:uncharacterized protein LOC129292699 isoform X1 n=1 Tax=Prosopis cineraria TaxID=364024 RepID=UPI00240F1D95|nr:uncharacterized protein LOC129292699 isoform X1 [Prosopis cineraria]XP_054786277.1 uncharacterized protein LOC129292699 isoform X1 [Prosopis cineraria]XP_054786278.1 uncharacterized protein LOC129292699 isoform X1 [Prosopis cineraria]
MPVSGREETGVKSYDGQFSGFIAAVPIKKRRFPLIPTFSPLSGKHDSLTEETESIRKEHSSIPQGSTVSNANAVDAPIKKRRLPSVQASSSLEKLSSLLEVNNALHGENSSTTLASTLSTNSAVLSGTNKNPAFEEKNATSDVTNANFAQNGSNYVSPKLEEPDLATHSRALDDADNKEKLIASENYEEKLGTHVKENSELLLAAKESLALNIGSKISKLSVEEKDKQESRASMNLSLDFKEHLSPAVTSLEIGESFQKTEKVASVSLKLSLSKDECSSKSFNDDATTNRGNWDLNSTMDAWEEPGSDATSGKTSTSGSGLQIAGSARNDNNVLCSPGMEPTGSASLKHTTRDNLNKTSMISSRLYGQQYKYVNSRNLCFASCLQKYSGEPSRLSVKQKSNSAIPTIESLPFSAGTACPPVGAICSEQLTSNASIVNHLDNHASTYEACTDEKASQGNCLGDKQVRSETVATAMVDNAESTGPVMKDCARGDEENADDAEGCWLKLTNDLPSDPLCSGEDGVSDDEKITLSADMLEDDSYCYDYESDGTHSLTVAMDIEKHCAEDDDYEDGEVREPLKHSVAEKSVCEVREVERMVSSNCDDGKQVDKEVLSGDFPASSLIEENDNRTLTRSKIDWGKDGIDSESINMSDNVADKTVCLQESLEAEKLTVGPQIRSLDHSERNKVLDATGSKLFSDQGNNGSNEVDIALCADEVIKNLGMVRETASDLPKIEVALNIDEESKDVSNGGNQGRIINLTQAASSLSPTKSRSIPGRRLSSQAGSDVLPDAFHHEKLHGGRDDIYIDGPCKFSRERHQDISPRNSRLGFVRGRGRINGRMDTCRGEWKSDRDFAGEFYNGPSHFGGPRHRFVSAVHDTESDYNNVCMMVLLLVTIGWIGSP